MVRQSPLIAKRALDVVAKRVFPSVAWVELVSSQLSEQEVSPASPIPIANIYVVICFIK